MAGRGRGRGRGRGTPMSFDYSQLGFTGGEAIPAPVLQPPPTFPVLENKPLPLKSGRETEYMVALKRDFVEFLQSLRQKNDSSSMIERFSDKYQVMSSGATETWDSQIYWDALPAELNPKGKRAAKRKLEKANGGTSAKKSNIDVTKKLDELAKLEVKEDEDSEEVKDSEEKDPDEEEKEELQEEEDEDEEMDDGTDYVNNYFDNGESYFDDEDDNLDDGQFIE